MQHGWGPPRGEGECCAVPRLVVLPACGRGGVLIGAARGELIIAVFMPRTRQPPSWLCLGGILLQLVWPCCEPVTPGWEGGGAAGLMGGGQMSDRSLSCLHPSPLSQVPLSGSYSPLCHGMGDLCLGFPIHRVSSCKGGLLVSVPHAPLFWGGQILGSRASAPRLSHCRAPWGREGSTEACWGPELQQHSLSRGPACVAPV